MSEQQKLREAVARAICEIADGDCVFVFSVADPTDTAKAAHNMYYAMADAAIAVALEQAARVAEQMLLSYTTMDSIPDAIRALTPSEADPSSS